MKRKVIQLAKKTLVVSLPSKWAEKNDVKKGDEISVFPEGANILFSTSDKHVLVKEITLSIDNFTYYSLSRYLTVLYRMNYNRITLTYSKNELLHDKKGKNESLKNLIASIVDRFIGAEIISQTATRTEIECFTSDQEQDLGKIEKRIYFLLKETITELISSIGKNYHTFHETTYNHHDNITKFINYYLRELNYSDWNEEKKRLAYGFYMLMDKLIDKMRHLSEKIDEFGCNDKVKKYIKETFEQFFEQYLLIEKINVSLDIIKKRYDLVKRISEDKFTANELQVIGELNIFLNVINDFSEYGVVRGLK